MSRRILRIGTCALFWLVAGVIRAQTPAESQACYPSCRAGFVCDQGRCVEGVGSSQPREGSHERPKNRLWVDTALTAGDGIYEAYDDMLVAALAARALSVVNPRVRITLDLPVTVGVIGSPTRGSPRDPDGNKSRVGNPTLMAHLHALPSPAFEELRVGAGFSLPIVLAEHSAQADAVAGVYSLLYATASQGFWNRFWYAHEQLSLLLPYAARRRSGGLEWGSSGTLATLIPVSSDGGALRFIWQLDAHLAWALRERDALGLRLQAVLSSVPFLPPSDDRAQLALEPYFEMSFGDVFWGGGWVLNLDGPVGVFGGAKLWMARMHIGFELP